jgi:hypothetical protein
VNLLPRDAFESVAGLGKLPCRRIQLSNIGPGLGGDTLVQINVGERCETLGVSVVGKQLVAGQVAELSGKLPGFF